MHYIRNFVIGHSIIIWPCC